MAHGNVLLKRIGIRSDNNEVWVGRPVNISAKLCTLANSDELVVSDRAYKLLNDEHIRYCCACSEKAELWSEKILINTESKKSIVYVPNGANAWG